MKEENMKKADFEELEFKYLKDLSEIKSKVDIVRARQIEEEKARIGENNMSNRIMETIYGLGYNPVRIDFVDLIEDNVAVYVSDEDILEVDDKKLNEISAIKDTIIIKDGYNNVSFFNKEVLEYAYMKELDDRIEKLKTEEKVNSYFHIKITNDKIGDYDRYDDDTEEDKIITKELIEKEIEKAIARKIEEEKKEVLRRVEEEKEIEVQAETKREDYEQKGIYQEEETSENGDNYGLQINNNTLFKQKWNKYIFTFEKPMNTFISFDEIKDLAREVKNSREEVNKILTLFLNKKVNFNLNCEDKSVADISFDGEKVKVDNIAVAKAKVCFILSKIRNAVARKDDKLIAQEKSKIELYNKLSGMKIEVTELKEIELSCEGINKGSTDRYEQDKLRIPINISLLDENFFKITMFDKTIPLNWDSIKFYFFERDYWRSGKTTKGTSRSPSTYFKLDKFKNLTTEMGMDKAFVFENLNKIRLFNAI